MVQANIAFLFLTWNLVAMSGFGPFAWMPFPRIEDETMTASDRPRLRDLGVEIGVLPPGPLNAITDVEGVLVGQVTVREGKSVRTGITAIRPNQGSIYLEKVPAAVFVGNGYGKAAGFLQVQELGTLETPIVLTNTLAVGTAVHAVVQWTLDQEGHENVRSVNAVVGETNDGFLNDIRTPTIREEWVRRAIDEAKGGSVEEGCVGAGTGTIAFGFKGGIGTASRTLPKALGGYTLGVLVQSNFGGVLSVDGVPVGKDWEHYPYRNHLGTVEGNQDEDPSSDGSCMIVIATDAPLDSRNLERVARRGVLGLARTGSWMSNGSGDFVIAFSTGYRLEDGKTNPVELLDNASMSPLFMAAVEAVEEAVMNSMLKATTTEGHRGTVEAISIERLKSTLARYGRFKNPR